jgi:hypothetical protein
MTQEDAGECCATAQVKRLPACARPQEFEHGVGDDAAIESFCHFRLRGGHSAGMSSSHAHILRLRPRYGTTWSQSFRIASGVVKSQTSRLFASRNSAPEKVAARPRVVTRQRGTQVPDGSVQPKKVRTRPRLRELRRGGRKPGRSRREMRCENHEPSSACRAKRGLAAWCGFERRNLGYAVSSFSSARAPAK